MLLPVAGAVALRAVNADADHRHRSALLLERLGNDFNNATAAAGWNIALDVAGNGGPSGDLHAAVARVERDLDELRSQDSSPLVRQPVAATAGFLPMLLGATPAGLREPGAAGIAAEAQVEHTRVLKLIDSSATTLSGQADAADTVVEVATWLVLIGVSAALLVAFRRGERRRRRAAVAEAGRRSLEESERTYRLLFQENPAPMWVFDPTSLQFLSVNRAAVATFGYSEDEFMAMTILDIRRTKDHSEILDLLGTGSWPIRASTRYLLKDGRALDAEVIVDRIEARGQDLRLVTIHDVTARRALEAELRDRALHDQLTGVANHALLVDRFDRAQAMRRRDGSPLSLVVLDIDGFRAVNETMGHRAGDAMLVSVAERLTRAVRPQDTVARIGGDEFVVLAEGADLAGAEELARRLLAGVAEPIDCPRSAGPSIVLSASAGVVAPETSEISCDLALQQASTALHEAKAAGRSCHRVYQPRLHDQAVRRMEIAAQLNRAVGEGELSLVYQPIVTLHPDGVHRVEALLRWQHRTLGSVSPADFIPIAEESGAIVGMGRWVLTTACRQVAEWAAAGRRVAVSVNVSGRQLRDPGFAAFVRQTLRESGVAPGQLTLEITETAMLADVEVARRTLTELRAAGVRVALDDFGAGYSSLAYLRELPLDVVKIDRAFVSALETDTDRQAMLLTIVRLLSSIHVRIVAEGVETAAELQYLAGMGIDAYQGWHFSRALPAGEVIAAAEAGWRDKLAVVLGAGAEEAAGAHMHSPT